MREGEVEAEVEREEMERIERMDQRQEIDQCDQSEVDDQIVQIDQIVQMDQSEQSDQIDQSTQSDSECPTSHHSLSEHSLSDVEVDLLPIAPSQPASPTSMHHNLPAPEDSSSDQGLESFLLPKTIVKRIIASATQNALFSKESKDLCTAAATLFVSYLTAAALECNDRNGAKKTLMPEAVLNALDACGFKEMQSAISVAYNAHKNSAGAQSTKKYKLEAECE